MSETETAELDYVAPAGDKQPGPEVVLPEAPEPAQPSVQDMAAHDYQTLMPIFYKRLEDCTSNRQLMRVIKALVEYPLGERRPKFSYQQEQDAFDVGMRVFDCKAILMKAVLDMSHEEITKFINDEKVGAV